MNVREECAPTSRTRGKGKASSLALAIIAEDFAAVSAGGTTLLELCACGIPTVCFAFADNQLEFAEEMAEHNLLIYAGDVREKDDAPHVICENLVCYTKDAGKRAQSFERMRRLVDGKGAERIAAFLQQYKRDV